MSTPISSVFKDDSEKVRVRAKLQKAVSDQTDVFTKVAQAFHDSETRTQTQCLALTEAIIDSINRVLEAGDWDSSLFLKNTAAPLRRLYDEAVQTKSELLREQGLETIEEYQLKEGEVKLYVSLYQADGHDLNRWALQLSSIDAYMAGRPVYKKEENVRSSIRQKLVQVSEAYAVVVVREQHLLANDFTMKKTDRQGYELATVEQGTVKSKDVIEFVHSGKRYHYYKEKLIEK